MQCAVAAAIHHRGCRQGSTATTMPMAPSACLFVQVVSAVLAHLATSHPACRIAFSLVLIPCAVGIILIPCAAPSILNVVSTPNFTLPALVVRVAPQWCLDSIFVVCEIAEPIRHGASAVILRPSEAILFCLSARQLEAF